MTKGDGSSDGLSAVLMKRQIEERNVIIPKENGIVKEEEKGKTVKKKEGNNNIRHLTY